MDKKVEIRKTLKEICDKDGMLQWEMHIIPVLKNAMNLAEMLKADKDVLEMGAYLHDIARISGKEGDHHIEGAKMAEEMLKKAGYPKPFIEKVSYCIRNHGSSFKECKTLEAKYLILRTPWRTLIIRSGLSGLWQKKESPSMTPLNGSIIK